MTQKIKKNEEDIADIRKNIQQINDRLESRNDSNQRRPHFLVDAVRGRNTHSCYLDALYVYGRLKEKTRRN